MTSVSQDVRFTLRLLLKHKGFAIVAVLTVALGIGINTAMFSVLNTFLFRSLPYQQSEQLVRVFRTSPHSQSWPHSAANFFDQHDQNTVFDKMAAYNFSSRNLTEQGQTAERLLSLAATADFFPLLGVAPARGRVFRPEEFEPGADNVIVLTDRFWTGRLGSDPNVVGRKIELDGKTVEIVGVMPPGFEHPILWGPIDIWQPLTFTPERKTNRGNNFLSSFGRLKPGVTIRQAEQSMVALAANLGKQNSSNEGESLRLEPLQRSMSDSIGRTVMWLTFGLAGFVLLIACANLANLQLVRTAARSREMAVPAALGARRWRLLRQSLTRSVLFALTAGIMNSDPGWSVDGLLTAQMSLRGEKYKEDKQRVVFLTELENRLKTLPGVQHAAIAGSSPVFGFNSSSSFLVEGRPEPPPDKYPEMFFEPVSSDYFETFGVRLQQGRPFNNADSSDHPKVVIINESAARTFWPSESPVGKRISSTGKKKELWEIVGVVNDLAFPGSLGEPYTRFEAFLPMAQVAPSYLTIALRTSMNADTLGNALRSSIAGLDSDLPVYRIRTARAMVDQGLGNISLLGSLLGAFAVVGLMLAAIGIYGVISYTVVQRTGELGIRVALGAQRRDVMKLILGKGAFLIVTGALLGVAGAYAVSRVLISLIPSFPTRDPLTLLATGFVLVVVALAACYIPARRATKVDPLVALRSE